jgi:hypothetical protein
LGDPSAPTESGTPVGGRNLAKFSRVTPDLRNNLKAFDHFAQYGALVPPNKPVSEPPTPPVQQSFMESDVGDPDGEMAEEPPY